MRGDDRSDDDFCGGLARELPGERDGVLGALGLLDADQDGAQRVSFLRTDIRSICEPGSPSNRPLPRFSSVVLPDLVAQSPRLAVSDRGLRLVHVAQCNVASGESHAGEPDV